MAGSDTFTPLIQGEHGAVIYPSALAQGAVGTPVFASCLDA